MNKGMYSSQTDMWATPQSFFDELNKEFSFTLDVCATNENAKCETFYTLDDDGLTQSWCGAVCWMNPPYGRDIKEWVKAAYLSGLCKCEGLVVGLLPARTDTKWFHDYIWDIRRHQPKEHTEVRFLKGRLKFGDSTNSAPFPSMVVIWK